jgi:hypothetical protein
MARPHLSAEKAVAAMGASEAPVVAAMDSRVAPPAQARVADDARFSKWI